MTFKTPAQRALAVWAATVGLWYFAVFISLFGSSWSGRAVSLVLAAGVTLILVLSAQRGFRRAANRPLPEKGLNGWLARQPGWRAAVTTGSLYFVLMTSVLLINHAATRFPPPTVADLVTTLSGVAIFAGGLGTFQALVIQRQREQFSADVAHQMHDHAGHAP